MKPSYEKLPVGENRSFSYKHFTCAYFDSPFHFHPEYELTYILKGKGQRFVGDHVSLFAEGDLVLIGPDLPHFWRSSHEYYAADSQLCCEAVVVHFAETFVQSLICSTPEFYSLSNLLNQCKQGLAFDLGGKAPFVKTSLLKLETESPARQLLIFLEILELLSSQPESQRILTLAPNFSPMTTTETKRMQQVLEYTLAHFKEPILLEQVAEIAHLSEAAFCRYFKKRCQKSYFSYLNELRIGHARQLLITSWMSVGQVAMESGFSNLSHFHRIFQRLTHVSPLHYRQLYRKQSEQV